jgi:PH (Pleckstrin Homology) domain-containing protein/putative oligomerization/nucleic acid binding protein
MAKSYIEKMMGENERILLVTRQHWFVLFGNILLEIVLMIVIVAGVVIATPFYSQAWVGFILVLVPFIGMLRDITIWRNRDYIITNRRVIQISGVLDKDVVDSSLEKVNDVKMSQSFWGRMFGFGDIEILTASELGVNLFHEIANPVEFKTAMLNAKEELGYGEGGVLHPIEDIPAMIAKLDNLRKQGIVTEVEFQKKKAELLAKM